MVYGNGKEMMHIREDVPWQLLTPYLQDKNMFYFLFVGLSSLYAATLTLKGKQKASHRVNLLPPKI